MQNRIMILIAIAGLLMLTGCAGFGQQMPATPTVQVLPAQNVELRLPQTAEFRKSVMENKDDWIFAAHLIRRMFADRWQELPMAASDIMIRIDALDHKETISAAEAGDLVGDVGYLIRWGVTKMVLGGDILQGLLAFLAIS